MVKRDAVVFVDGKPTVFRAESETRVVPVPVRLGTSNESESRSSRGSETTTRSSPPALST